MFDCIKYVNPLCDLCIIILELASDFLKISGKYVNTVYICGKNFSSNPVIVALDAYPKHITQYLQEFFKGKNISFRKLNILQSDSWSIAFSSQKTETHIQHQKQHCRFRRFKCVCIAGTFDHLHIDHKGCCIPGFQ